jgi:Right handed beta helix region
MKFNLTLILFVISVFTAPLMATDFYTSTTGSDSGNNCQNIASPCNLSNGFDNELSQVVGGRGDTIWMCAGACDGSGSATVSAGYRSGAPSGTSFANALTITPYTGETITLTGGISVGSGESYIIWKGPNLILTTNSVWLGNGSNHIRLQDMELTDIHVVGSGGAVFISWSGGNPSQYNELIRLHVHHNGTGQPVPNGMHGAYIQAPNNTVDGGYWHDQHDENVGGIQLYVNGSIGGNTNNTVIKNAKVCNNTWGIALWSGTNLQAYNNVICNNPTGGIGASVANNTLIYNNTIVGNSATSGYAVQVTSGTGHEIRNNIIYGNGSGVNIAGGTVIQSNNTFSDPLFVNSSTQDYRLQSGSPAIDAGITLSLVKTDMNGVARPQGSSYDIGAFEYTSKQPAVAPPSNLRVTSVQ